MTSVNQVAAYFLMKVDEEFGEGITNLKMQKLVYYAQAFHLALFGIPLFEEKIEAWQHGPVVPELYHALKKYESSPIDPEDPIFRVKLEFTEDQIEFLDEIYDNFARFSAWRLRDMTHSEAPWIDAFEDKWQSEIAHDSLRNFYSKMVQTQD